MKANRESGAYICTFGEEWFQNIIASIPYCSSAFALNERGFFKISCVQFCLIAHKSRAPPKS